MANDQIATRNVTTVNGQLQQEYEIFLISPLDYLLINMLLSQESRYKSIRIETCVQNQIFHKKTISFTYKTTNVDDD